MFLSMANVIINSYRPKNIWVRIFKQESVPFRRFKPAFK